MAALGSIRKRGGVLIVIVGLGLFAFIAEEFFRSCESTRNEQRQQVGEVLGEKVSVQDFQKLVDEYTEVIKMQQGQQSLNDEQLNQVKDMVWNTYVQGKLVENEAEKLGLAVTDEEMQNILNEGTNQLLLQSPFVNQQTGRFDVNALKKFLAEYKTAQASNPQMAEQYTTIYKYWTFLEKTLRQQTLAQKYQSLFAHCFLSNPVEAKMAFNDENTESNIELASFSYASVKDDQVKYTDADLKAKYDELKPRFKQYVESRDVKYVAVTVGASATDRKELQKQFADYSKSLAASADPVEVVRKSTSSVPYLGVPVTKSAFSADIAARLDSMAVGSIYGPFESKQDNTLNLVKLVAKQQLPDSIQFRAIQVQGATMAESAKTADSIMTALNGGADFEAIAKKYGQTGAKNWMTTAQYQGAPSMDKDTKAYISTLNTAPVGQLQKLTAGQGQLIVEVTDRKAMTEKYVAAVVKRTIDFSKDTYSNAYNKFSSFVSANQTAEAIAKNAKSAGYMLMDAKDVTTSAHYLAGIHSTREALKWVFEAKEGDVSPMYECGDNNTLLVAVLDKVHAAGYRSLDDAQVKELVKAEVLRDKKAEMLMAKAEGVKNIAAAKAKGAQVAAVNQVTFSAPVFVQTTGASEPALSGAVAATAKGQFSSKPVKGLGGVYVFQVAGRTQGKAKFVEKEVEQRQRQKAMQYAGNFMNELYAKAKIVDNRYLFF